MTPQRLSISETPIRVMVVETHQLILWALTKLINSHRPGMEVVAVAGSQSDALFQLPTAAPDLVLMKYELAVTACQADLPEVLTCGRHTLLFAEELGTDTLASTLRCGAHGLLSRRSSADEIVKAIEKTHQGELWFGREATCLALNALRGGEAVRPHPHHDGLDALTPRERRVLQTVVANKVRTNRDLAKILFISESTLRNHLSSIYQKLGVSNRLDLYVYAQSHLVTHAAEMA
ncbi:response regulator transcription factor [Massilia kyonggiensis]|nr:response regulator transcription factor [Massilia kyonggiensis]